MKTIVRILSLPLIGLVCVGLAQAQSTPASAKEEKSAASSSAATTAPRTDVYHVHFNHAAPGKAAALADFLKAGNPNGPMPGHVLVLRHQDALEKFLSEPPARSNDLSVGNVLMQHLEGGAWRYLTISRYKSWQDFATSESNSVAQSSKGEGGWFQLREHISFHNDTVTYRIAP